MLNVKNFKLLNRKRTWLEIFLIAFGIAFLIAAWPTARCAIADCSPRDRWCANDCSMECYRTRRVTLLLVPGYVRFNASGQPYCTRPITNTINGSCWDYNWCGGVVLGHDQRLPPNPQPFQQCVRVWGSNTYTCCRRVSTGGGGGGGGGSSCTPEYAKPNVTLTAVDPPYPIPIGQDPEKQGFDVLISAQGGEKTNDCDEGPDRASLEDLSVDAITLSAASITWIEEELSQPYPGAHVLASYPLSPSAEVDLNVSTGTITFHVDSYDPGDYIVTVSARQDRGDEPENQEEFTVRVWLMEGTIWGGGK